MELLFNPFSLQIITLTILVFSAILHEVAHGYVADRLGDPTARLLGRLTLDPRPHIDPFMSILLPFLLLMSGSPILFGGAKPVPVDPYNLREGRKDIALVSLSGPLTNMIIALIAAIIIRFFFQGADVTLINPFLAFISFILKTIVEINIMLAIFNLLPIPPLDGSKVFALILPEEQAKAYLSVGQYGTFILLFLLVFPVFGFSLSSLIYSLYSFTMSLLGISL